MGTKLLYSLAFFFLPFRACSPLYMHIRCGAVKNKKILIAASFTCFRQKAHYIKFNANAPKVPCTDVNPALGPFYTPADQSGADDKSVSAQSLCCIGSWE